MWPVESIKFYLNNFFAKICFLHMEGCYLNSISILVFLPFFAAICIPLIYKFLRRKIHLGWFVLIVPIIIFLQIIRKVTSVASGDTFLETISWLPSIGINLVFYVDGLALLFGLLISGIGMLVILYSIFYLSKVREELHNFYFYLMLFMGAMLGLVFSDNLFVLYGFWELTSISSFLLIAYWYERKSSRNGALKSLMITVFGGLCMLAGFVLLANMADTYSIRELIHHVAAIKNHVLYVPALICILLGAFTKSAQFPFGIWLPDAMEAPTPVSAYLHSATMVKAGIYLVARLTPVFAGSATWFWLVSGIGIITLLYGSITAVRQTDLKALLAYSTISQLGLIMSLLGLGSLAFTYQPDDQKAVYFSVAIFAAIFHLFNHSTFKGSLFMVVGIIDHETGTRDIRRLGGLMYVMPISFTIALIGSFSMAGLPPFNGFLSKEMFFTAVNDLLSAEIFHLDTFGILFPVLAWIASIFTFVYSMILVFRTFTGKYRREKLSRKPHEAPIGMLISPIILASFVIIIFLFPNVFSRYLLKPAFVSVLPMFTLPQVGIDVRAWHGWNMELLMTIGVIIIGTYLFITMNRWIGLFRSYPESLTLNYMYEKLRETFEHRSASVTNRYMTGSIRHYFIYIFTFFIIVMSTLAFWLHGLQFDFSNNHPITIYDIGLVIGIVITAFTVLLTNHRITAIVSLSVLGYFVMMFFVIFRAPDLALTQMVVETVTTVLFLLCFYHLPKLQKSVERMKWNGTNVIIAIATGVVVTTLTLLSNSHKLYDSISSFFENAYELAGAKNIVNAILVDFRGFDTMLEISVLCIAGLGVYTLIRLQTKGSDRKDEAK